MPDLTKIQGKMEETQQAGIESSTHDHDLCSLLWSHDPTLVNDFVIMVRIDLAVSIAMPICVICHLCLHDALYHSLFAYQWLHLTFDVIACEFTHLSWSCLLHSPWIANWQFTCHVHFALSDLECILWIIVSFALHFDLSPMSDWQFHVHGAWHNALLMIVS